MSSITAASGIYANPSKSAIYLARISTVLKTMIAQELLVPHGSLPFKYLGVLLTSKRLSNNDCDILVDKMTSRIKAWYKNRLSYAARLQLVNSVLMSISMY